jgi:hypothetical protein
VPEATVDEHDNSSFRKNDVGAYAWLRSSGIVDPISQTLPVKEATKRHLAICIATPLRDHS